MLCIDKNLNELFPFMNRLRSITFIYFFLITLQSVMAQGNKGLSSQSSSAIEQKNEDFKGGVQQYNQKFQDFLNEQQRKFDNFRKKQNKKFADFLEKGRWDTYERGDSIKRPKERDVQPIVYDKSKDNSHGNEKQQVREVPYEQPILQPKPLIKENGEMQKYDTFTFYGTKMKVRWGDLANFKLRDLSGKALADGYRILTADKYNNLLSDCLNLREGYTLCDWAYYKMLEALAETVCGKKSKEAVFLQGVLYQQSGYTMRFAIDRKDMKLQLLVKIKGVAYGYQPIPVNGNIFYSFGSKDNQPLEVCDMTYKDEQDMQMNIGELPRLDFNLTEMKTRKSESFNVNVTSAVNKNLLEFMKDYPTTYDGRDMMTRWAYYANTSASEEVRYTVYSQLKEKLKDVDELQAVNWLLNWVQTGFEYELDEKLWGQDRAFFAEETLFYPFSDCEDRAILFSRLVRDLVGLDVVLVYYPGDPAHLSTAVCFKNHVEGYHHDLNGKKFVVADPCYIRAGVGRMMPDYIGTEGKVILLSR